MDGLDYLCSYIPTISISMQMPNSYNNDKISNNFIKSITCNKYKINITSLNMNAQSASKKGGDCEKNFEMSGGGCEDIPRRPKECFSPLLPSTKRTLRQSSSAADQLERLQA